MAKVERALAQNTREIAAIHEAIQAGESTNLPIEQRKHPAVIAALAQRPR